MRIAACIVLVYGKESLHDESGFYEVAAIVFLSERLYPPRIAIPPVGVGAVKAVGGFEERNDAFHTCQAFFTGDVAPVDTGKHCHDAETAAAAKTFLKESDQSYYTALFQNADFPYQETFPECFSYEYEGSIYFSLPVAHALGDYILAVYTPENK